MATDARSDLLLSAALEYAGHGWRVVPLRDGKIPRIKAWQREASVDEATISAWWEQWPDSNVGVKLGPDSGIVDVECDSPEAETLLLKLFNNDPPVTPTFQSSRGRHRLFRWRPDLPSPEKNSFKIGKLEIRTGNGDKGAQSVFPPSRHLSGTDYTWLVHPGDCDPADFSQVAFAALWNATPEDLLNESVGGMPGQGGGADPTERARRYLAKLPPAVSGNEGSKPTYRAACVLVLGFNFTTEQAFPLLEEYSSRCDPPWSEAELRHKLDDANKEGGERGYLLLRQKAPPAVAAVVSQSGISEGNGEAPPDFGKLVHKEACGLWREQYMLRGARCFDDPEIQAVVFKRLWGFNAAFCAAAPLSSDAVLEKCSKGMEFIRARVDEEEDKAPSLTALGLEYKNGEWWPGQWRVEVVNSDPPDATLHAPFLAKPVLMPLARFDEPDGVHAFVRDATLGRVCLDDKPGFWPSVWKGQKGNKKEGILPTVGLRVKLLREAEHLEAAPEQKRLSVLADMVLQEVRSRSKSRKGSSGLTIADPGTAVQKMEDGTVLLRFQFLLSELRLKYKAQIEASDMTKLFKATRILRKPWRESVGGYYHVKDEQIKNLEEISER